MGEWFTSSPAWAIALAGTAYFALLYFAVAFGGTLLVRQLGRLDFGRVIEGMPAQYREWLIDFGDSGYVARYHIDPEANVTILAVGHQREAGF